MTKRVTVIDENLESVTLDGEPVGATEFILPGDTDAVYVIRATDKAGNVTEYTVTMKPISAITDPISEITADNVKSSDSETVSTVKETIADITGAPDYAEATESEKNKLSEASEKCDDLEKRIAEVAAEINRLTDGVNGYDIDSVTSDDRSDIEKLISDIDALLDRDNLTGSERSGLEALREKAKALLDRIDAAKAAAGSDDITAVDGITKDNVKPGDKDALKKAEKAIEDALRDFGGNYTDKEQKDLEDKLARVKNALSALDGGHSPDTGITRFAVLLVIGAVAAGTTAAGKKKKRKHIS